MNLLTLLQQYARIALLMAKPQDLPAGAHQMLTGIVLCAITYVLAVASIDGVLRAIAQAFIEIGLTGLLFWVGLSIVNRSARFAQAFGGLCGANAMLQIVAIPVFMGGNGAEFTAIGAFSQFFLIVWSLSLLGHVFRHTFETSIPVSIAVAFLFFIFTMALLTALIPPPMPQTALLQAAGVWVV
ncbi:MAG: hypothetical protein V3U65_18720 [Granulosicoccaceae bacterium]